MSLSHRPKQYTGVLPANPPNVITANRAPTSDDTSYREGDIWIYTSAATAWVYGSTSGWIAIGTGATGGIATITGDSGGAKSPLAGNFSLLGTANQIAVTGGANKETFSLIGPYTPATYTSYGVLTGAGTSSIVATAAGTNGQVLLGSTGAAPAFGTLTSSDSSVSFTTGAGSLSLQVSSTLAGKASVTLTSAQIKNLRATPITVVAAQGAGKSILVTGLQLKFVYGGSNVFTNPQDFTLQYKDGTGQIVASGTGAGFLDQAVNMYQTCDTSGAVALSTEVENNPIVIHNSGGSEITGNAANDNTIVVTVLYTVLTQ